MGDVAVGEVAVNAEPEVNAGSSRVAAFVRARRWESGVAVGAFLGALVRTQPRFREDQSVFMTVFDGVARGDRLYLDVFDHKDPVFFWLGGLVFALFGNYGPFILELLLVSVFAVAVFRIARHRQLSNPVAAAIATVAAGFLLRPLIYNGLSTSVVGMTLVAVAALLIITNQPRAAGITVSTLAFTKMLFVPLALPALAVLAVTGGRRSIIRFMLSSTLTGLFWFLVLLVRGELPGFVDQVELNRTYAAGISLQEHLERMWGFVSRSPTLVLLLGLSLIASLVLTIKTLRQGWRSVFSDPWRAVAVAVYGGSMALLAISYFWNHHLQLMAFGLALLAIEIAVLMQDINANRRYQLSLAVPLLAAGVLMLWPTLDDARAARDTVDRWTIAAPRSAFALEEEFALLQPTGEIDFAILTGQIQGFMPFVDDRFDLVCPIFAQQSWLEHRNAETAACFSTEAEYVVRLDRARWEQLPARLEEYKAVLDADFELRAERTLPDGSKLLIYQSTR